MKTLSHCKTPSPTKTQFTNESFMSKNFAISEMLIRRPTAEVFDAFVRRETICKFWLKSTSARLAKGAKAKWQFMVPGATEHVTVTAFERGRRIAFNWSDGIKVEIKIAPIGDDATHIQVKAHGFKGKNAAAESINATEGFSIVLCDLKTLLEFGTSANLVRDKAKLIALKKPTEPEGGA